jgi:hypothetical protein
MVSYNLVNSFGSMFLRVKDILCGRTLWYLKCVEEKDAHFMEDRKKRSRNRKESDQNRSPKIHPK